MRSAPLRCRNVPVQEVRIETIRVSPSQERAIPYALNNLALACYAKLGGTPFVISAGGTISHELIIGIG